MAGRVDPDDRVLSIPLLGTGETLIQEALSSTVEVWFGGLEAEAIAQFGVDPHIVQ